MNNNQSHLSQSTFDLSIIQKRAQKQRIILEKLLNSKVQRNSQDQFFIFQQLTGEKQQKKKLSKMILNGFVKPVTNFKKQENAHWTEISKGKILKRLENQRVIQKPLFKLTNNGILSQRITINVINQYKRVSANKSHSRNTPSSQSNLRQKQLNQKQKSQLQNYLQVLQLIKRKQYSRVQPIQSIHLRQRVNKPSIFKPFDFKQHLISRARLTLRGWQRSKSLK